MVNCERVCKYLAYLYFFSNKFLLFKIDVFLLFNSQHKRPLYPHFFLLKSSYLVTRLRRDEGQVNVLDYDLEYSSHTFSCSVIKGKFFSFIVSFYSHESFKQNKNSLRFYLCNKLIQFVSTSFPFMTLLSIVLGIFF